jgi:mannitol/fructose-specific phosphotransferase system IIA component (Ntr-type)
MDFRLSDLLEPDRIRLDLRAGDREACVLETARLLTGHPAIMDFPGFERELLARFRLETTSLGNGVALPHARTDCVRRMVVAAGVYPAGLDYDDTLPRVRMIFAVGTPLNRPGDYLGLVRSLCRIVRDESSRETLLAASSPGDFISTVRALEHRILGESRPD